MSSYSQDTTETTSPIYDVEIVRKVSRVDIEGTIYNNVVVSMKSYREGIFSSNIVKIKIVNNEGEIIWKKTLNSVYLYVFSDGQVQIGKMNFHQIIIYKDPYSDDYYGTIREKEGVF